MSQGRQNVDHRWCCLGPILLLAGLAHGDHRVVPLRSVQPAPPPPEMKAPVAPGMPPLCAAPQDRPYPINLATALTLAGVRPLDVGLAQQRVELAVAQLKRADVLWLPSILIGPDYFRHDGQIQDVQGNVFGTSKSTFLAGFAPTAVFAVTDAVFEPLAARQVVRARDADLQAARNDSFLAVAEAYFNVQQARG